MTTNLVPCSPQSANFYVAGMYASTQYLMHWEEYAGTTLVNTGSDLPFTTGALPSGFVMPTYHVNVPPTADDAAYPVVVSQLNPPFMSTATDLAGNVIWYVPQAASRFEPGGYFYTYPGSNFAQIDLAGNVVLETNPEIMNEQLAAKGYPTITAFNGHEARNLPDGNIALLGSRNVISTSAQGGTPTNPVDIVGDMILVVDHNMQLVWAWDAFAHQDVNRVATLNDKCGVGAGGCAPIDPNFTTANDWLHSNALQGTADGNIIISERAQDWVLKINYANGKGDGSVIWKMGAGGDFTIVNPPSETCGSPLNVFPWFTHQHDPAYQFQNDPTFYALQSFQILTIFDDGNTRAAQCPGTQNSRGMVLLVNEPARQIYVETSADLGAYSAAVGSAQLLTPPSGNIYASFDNGFLGSLTGVGEAQVSEVDLAGNIVYQLQVNSDAYRTYRMPNLYTPTVFETGVGMPGGLATNQAFDFSSGFPQDQDSLQFNGNAALSGVPPPRPLNLTGRRSQRGRKRLLRRPCEYPDVYHRLQLPADERKRRRLHLHDTKWRPDGARRLRRFAWVCRHRRERGAQVRPVQQPGRRIQFDRHLCRRRAAEPARNRPEQ